MATRRPATRTRTTSHAMPPPTTTNRPRSVLAKSGSSQRSTLTTPSEDSERSTPAPPSHPPSPRRKPTTRALQPTHSQHQGQDEDEGNIQVVIRCRRRSEREIQDNSPIIASCGGPLSREVTIETAAPVSSLGIVTLPPTRTYPFDAVFGPEADQAMIYNDVVHPLLDEVMQGYNCTLFAYGQTGTGKTYTMQGDLTPTPMGNPSAHAGMIPRVLFRLFHQLETSASDYSVKISFIELYNEELRDLLAPELAAPLGSVQPMGLGQKDNVQSGLKIFEEASKKGVFIQGLEEPSVKDAADALELLARGSHRRQVAATKFNDHSSRSHSVFSITVHTKETSSMGDDLLKVGKLNLVDLAGSENIGRSGAENKRAREAGMINQSLLTLGRVINALVDKSSHIPYRESKLTRLLQDSLGGRTKTCIIATISPARSNMEETLSTLDYAMRAKSIRNRPEVNQRMTRNTLLKEYVAEIERLKADLLAAREKNGIFFAEDTWMQMTAENELRQTELEESKKQVEIVESQMKAVREEFEQSIALLMRTQGELKETKEKLKGTEEELQATSGQLKAAKRALEEENVVRQAHQRTEAALDEVARGLKGVAAEAIKDLVRLFEKLERKSNVLSSNAQAVQTHGNTVSGELQGLTFSLTEFVKSSDERTSGVQSIVDQYRTTQLQSLSQQSMGIEEQAKRFKEMLQIIEEKENISSEAAEALQGTVSQFLESLKTSWQAWTKDVQGSHEALTVELRAHAAQNTKTIQSLVLNLHTLLEKTVSEAQIYVESESVAMSDVKAMTDAATAREVARLREQNATFAKLLESERAKGQRAKDELLERVSGLLSSFAAERDRSLRESFEQLQTENTAAEARTTRLGDDVGSKAEERFATGKEWRVSLERRQAEGKRTRDGTFKALSSFNTDIGNGLSNMQSSTSTSVSTFTNTLRRDSQAVQSASQGAFDRINRAKRARLETTTSMATDVQSGYRSCQRGLALISRDVESMAEQIMSESTSLRNATTVYHGAALGQLNTTRQSTATLLQEGTRRDTPTGTSPRKRTWAYQDHWERTKDRQTILKSWRSRNKPQAGNDTFLAEHLPLPGESDKSADEASEDDPDVQADSEEQDTVKILADLPSMSSSTTSTSTASTLTDPPVTKTEVPMDSAIPIGLAERPSNLPIGRRPRRIR
ncbi:kinesin-domain-containing protein [Neolentinus lepideus HHB14362 ss-1]|uniref:Kinesin-domain-containing protein n=1 Tax=Neolentinus lepideus HHB14362 ss-1 TaxID=1314782 RepID=A0A165TBY3_9AGAM|nr:kinesin-domain-containing protein [Neolentinus lepideus HHB14362 ss-1]